MKFRDENIIKQSKVNGYCVKKKIRVDNIYKILKIKK